MRTIAAITALCLAACTEEIMLGTAPELPAPGTEETNYFVIRIQPTPESGRVVYTTFHHALQLRMDSIESWLLGTL